MNVGVFLKIGRDHETEYTELRMDFHFRSDACPKVAKKISRLLNSHDYDGIRRLRLSNH